MKMQMNTYNTSDYQLAVTLASLGYRLISVEKSDPRRAVFQFEPSSNIQADSEAFFQDRLSLNPRTILTNAKLIKGRLHAGV
jgi:hypothetical protein